MVLVCRAHPEIRASLEAYLHFLYPEIRLPGPADNLIDLTAYLPGSEK